jgi:hypothetical protein
MLLLNHTKYIEIKKMLYRFEANRGDEVAITIAQDGVNLPLEKGPWRAAGIISPDDPRLFVPPDFILQTVDIDGFYITAAGEF